MNIIEMLLNLLLSESITFVEKHNYIVLPDTCVRDCKTVNSLQFNI